MANQNFYWAANLKFLRNRKKMSQEAMAEKLDIARSKLAMHESGAVKNPPLDDLVKISNYFKISIDTLLKIDLSKLGELKMRELEAGNDVYMSGSNLRVLALTVDRKNKENIEFVPLKAKAGYLNGYNDPEYIAQLPKFSMPQLPDNKTFRVFPTEGDSMLPIPENCLVITEYVPDWKQLNATPCIVIMRNEQSFLFKIVTIDESKGTVLLHSLNPAYEDKVVPANDVAELWKYHSYITDVIPASETIMQELLRTVNEIKIDVQGLTRNR